MNFIIRAILLTKKVIRGLPKGDYYLATGDYDFIVTGDNDYIIVVF